MNNFEQGGIQAEAVEAKETTIGELKHLLAEWLSADIDPEERVRRQQTLENKKAILLEHFGERCRGYQTFGLLSSNTESSGAGNFDFPEPFSLASFIESLIA